MRQDGFLRRQIYDKWHYEIYTVNDCKKWHENACLYPKDGINTFLSDPLCLSSYPVSIHISLVLYKS